MEHIGRDHDHHRRLHAPPFFRDRDEHPID
jgi:hypothetical protein